MVESVYVVGGEAASVRMFHERGYKIVFNMKAADIVCFTGGADINPELYGEVTLHHHNRSMYVRDKYELDMWESCPAKALKVGICRGGQLLNVMNGGKLYQDVDNHRTNHEIVDFLISKDTVRVTSCHHQMMIPEERGLMLAASKRVATTYRTAEFPDGVPEHMKPDWEPEALWYNHSRCFCFQGHPEWGHKETALLFFDYIDTLL